MQPHTVHLHQGSAPLSREMAGHRLSLLPAAAYDVGFVADADTIGFAFDVQTGSHAVGSDRQENFVRLPNTLALTPGGCDVRSRSDRGGEYLLLSGGGICLAGDCYRTNIPSKSAFRAASRLRMWLLSDALPASLESEACIARLSEAVQKPQRPDKAARWMTGNRFRKVTDRIEADLGSSLTVAGLAAEIGVSASFLSRAFSAYCGQSPYDYIVSRRLQRARALIASTCTPLSEIALSSGFSSQSHMTESFRTRLGISPSKIARPDNR
ncbi:helix-turn-helix transcriptional regulator [Roseibium aggregatum]|nr:helix-turn-helix transcriptional regulator [Roseibium aggregatum]